MKVSTRELENITEVADDGSPCVIKQQQSQSDFPKSHDIILQTSLESPDGKKQKGNVDYLDSDEESFMKIDECIWKTSTKDNILSLRLSKIRIKRKENKRASFKYY